MSTTWSTPRHVASLVRTVVSCVMVKTKTRSKKSSSVETRTTSSGADSAASECEFLGLLGQREPVVGGLVHLSPVLHRAAAAGRVERVRAAGVDQLLRALTAQLHDELAVEGAAEPRATDPQRRHAHHLRLGDVAAGDQLVDDFAIGVH